MRIIYRPVMLPLGYYASSVPEAISLLLDPLNYHPEGLRAAAEYYHIPPYVPVDDPTASSEEVTQGLENARRHIIDHPEMVFESIPQGYPDRHSEIESCRNDPAFTAESARYHALAHTALEKLPPYLQSVQQEKATLAIVKNFSTFAAAHRNSLACANGDYGLIAIREDVLAKPQKAIEALKEEIIHYFDHKLDWHSRNAVMSAALSVLHDDRKMQELESLVVHIRPDKQPIRQYEEIHRPAELLVEYFFIRDHLQALSQKGGCAFGGMIRSRNDNASVRRQMETLFSPEYCKYCDGFEQALTSRRTTRSL